MYNFNYDAWRLNMSKTITDDIITENRAKENSILHPLLRTTQDLTIS